MNEKTRCSWLNTDSKIYVKYHDEEWGVPVYDDETLFEMLILESFQSGLSWLTILKRRKGFKEAFDNFDIEKIIKYNDKKIEELLANESIIRHKGKILATINNAKIFKEIQEEFQSFSNYIWNFTDRKIIKNENNEIHTKTELSDRIAKDLKKRGIKFLGSVTVYSYLQAIGIVNDHETSCFKYKTTI